MPDGIDAHLQQQILALEQSLLQPHVRASIRQLDARVADDFVEISSTGRRFGKDEVLSRLPVEAGRFAYEISDFTARALAEGWVLALYRATITDRNAPGEPRHSLRSSLWKRGPDGWQMTFHQGTPSAPC